MLEAKIYLCLRTPNEAFKYVPPITCLPAESLTFAKTTTPQYIDNLRLLTIFLRQYLSHDRLFRERNLTILSNNGSAPQTFHGVGYYYWSN
jgi:hypothetical protein